MYDQSGKPYNTSKQIRFKTSTLRADLCDYSDACIVVDGTIIIGKIGSDVGNIDTHNRKLIFQNNAPFTSSIWKQTTLADNAEADVIMSMYNLIDCGKYYRKTLSSFLSYYRDQENNRPDDNYNAGLITTQNCLNIKQKLKEVYLVMVKQEMFRSVYYYKILVIFGEL